MKRIILILIMGCLVSTPSFAQLSSNKMMKIVTRCTAPDVPSTSFQAQPRTLYRLGETYGRSEEVPDPDLKLHGLMVIAEPKVWMINLWDKTGRLIIDPGPTYGFHAPILSPGERNQATPLPDFEFGTEYDFLRSHGAQEEEVTLGDEAFDKLSLSLEGYTINLLSHRATQRPYRVTVFKGDKIVDQYDYDEYTQDLEPQMDLFAPPSDVRIAETAAETQLPLFLPAYYAPAFSSRGAPLSLVSPGETNGVIQYTYSTSDESLALCVEKIECDRPRCDAIVNNLLGYLNQLITSNQGSFVEITETEAHAEVVLTNAAQIIFTYVLPSCVQIWTFSGPPTNRSPLGADFQTIRGWANRQRYEEALQAGNVSMGHWQKCIYDYAVDLLKSAKKDDALTVLKNLLSTSPFDYEAHLQFVSNTADMASASNSAKTVFKNAETPDQIAKAASFIGAEPRTIDGLAPLATNETGLEVILIPLPPCNPWLLDEVAKVYERITEIPVKTRRLKEGWSWGAPERISQQRYVQGLLVSLSRQDIDFTNWTKDRYIEALSDAVKSEDALSKYWVHDLVNNIEKEPGQYSVDPYLDRLCATLKNYRSKDNRTMYVAITEANIYSGDNNYVFSLGRTDQESPASIMSYHMMLGRTLHETYDSRQRLVERIAKELVPASLKQLGIPRSTDPTCPYS